MYGVFEPALFRFVANLYYNDNFYNDTVRERDAYSRFLIIFYFIFSNRPFKFYSFNN
jgi:hypothetical protein